MGSNRSGSEGGLEGEQRGSQGGADVDRRRNGEAAGGKQRWVDGSPGWE